MKRSLGNFFFSRQRRRNKSDWFGVRDENMAPGGMIVGTVHCEGLKAGMRECRGKERATRRVRRVDTRTRGLVRRSLPTVSTPTGRAKKIIIIIKTKNGGVGIN